MAATTQPASTQPSANLVAEIEKPTSDRPVTGAVRIETGRITPGSDVDICVLVRIAPGHWLYAHTDGDSPFNPLSLKLTTGAVSRESGTWHLPTPDDRGRLTGNAEFRQSLHIARETAPGTYPLACELTYEVCNPDLCWPTRTLRLETKLKVVDPSP